jgi:hypothetical protein
MIATLSDIGIITLMMAWSALNHSLIQDWIAQRGQKAKVST